MKDESVRAQVLQRMGVQQWYARYRLPGAAPSPKFETSEQNTSSSLDHETQEPAGTPEIRSNLGAPSTSEAISEKAAPNISIEIPRIEPQAASVSMTTGVQIEPETTPSTSEIIEPVEIETLKVRAFCFDTLTVISDVDSELPDSQEQELAENIAKSIYQADDNLSAQTKQLHWPPFNNAHLLAQVGTTLNDMATRWLDEIGAHNTKRLMYLGGSDSSSWKSILSTQTNAIACRYSLGDMLRQPSLKRELWQALVEKGWHQK